MAAAAGPAQPWSAEELRSEALAKKEIIKFLQEHAAQAVMAGDNRSFGAVRGRFGWVLFPSPPGVSRSSWRSTSCWGR